MLKIFFSVLCILFFTGSQICIATPLIDAIKADDISLVQKLIQDGADIDARDKNGRTALMLAAFKGHSETIQVLLNNKADIHARA